VQNHPPSTPDSQLDADAAVLWEMLFQVVLDGEKRLAEHLALHNVSAPQFYVLKTLSEHNGQMGIGTLARKHGLTNASMTGLIKRMEAQTPPLVERRTDSSDKRAVQVFLTEAGAQRFHAIQASLLDQLRAAFGLLPPEARARLLADLTYYVGLVRSALAIGL
jgi:DNA-binding MarR family transcriptional regulator